MMTFYHASQLSFQIGDTWSTDQFVGNATLDHVNRSKEEQQVNILMDSQRPSDYDSRNKSIFLFDNIDHCRFYASRLKNPNLKIYKVKALTPVFGGFPFCLVEKVYNESSFEIKKRIIQEYWAPTLQWIFLEYITQSIEILDILNMRNPVLYNMAIASLSEDIDRFNNMRRKFK